MRVGRTVSAYGSWRHLAARLLVFVLCLRALIPNGFMTDADAAAAGVFKIVICSSGSSHSIAILDDSGTATDGEPQKLSPGNDQPCAFSANSVAIAGAHHSASMITPPVFDIVPFYPARHTLLPPARAGPVLGSRAPPAIS
ncbi:MAG: hypothetical protein ABL893_00265 [Hyphomicrobium sp.]|nr:hypothetical protein [Hyphomicrobium sp.]